MASPIPFGTEFLPVFTSGNQSAPHVAGLSDGTMLIAWHDGTAGADDSGGVWFQILDANGAVISATATQANTILQGNQLEPAVAALAGGGFAVVYTDDSQSTDDPSGTAIRLMVAGRLGPFSGENGSAKVVHGSGVIISLRAA